MRDHQESTRARRIPPRLVAIGGASALVLGGAFLMAAPAAAFWGAGNASCTDPGYTTVHDVQRDADAVPAYGSVVYLGAGANISSNTSLAIQTSHPVTIDLCGGSLAITIPNGTLTAGVHVPVGAALTIQDSVGGGSLTADLSGAGYAGAAIGGGVGEGAGTITIDGGTVTAKVGSYAGAAIGGGYGGDGVTGATPTPGGTGGAGGDVIVNGGAVSAIVTDFYAGAAIGGGSGGFGGIDPTLTVRGGAGGDGGAGGTLTVNGGTVTAIAYDHPYGSTAIGGGSGGPGGAGSTPGSPGASGAAGTVRINGGTLSAQARKMTIGPGTTFGAVTGAPGTLEVAGDWITGITPVKPAPSGSSSSPTVTALGGTPRFVLTNGTNGGSLTTRIEFVDALAQVTPSATTATLGDTITVTGKAHLPSGATYDVSSALLLSSSVPQDVISGNTVTFPHASPHVITVSYGGVSTSFTVQVSAPAAGPTLADTGTDPAPWLAAAALLLLLGGALRLARSRRPHPSGDDR